MSNALRDPRHLNVTLDSTSIDSYKREYAAAFQSALNEVDSAEVDRLCDAIQRCTLAGGQIFVAGNGGSAAIAEHLCCDWTKGTACEGHPIISSRSLTANNALYSAIANDYGFESVFDTQIDFFAREGDLLIAISSSGNSANIVNAAQRAKKIGLFVAGFTGFKGGKLREIADASIHVPISNYGIVEDAHQSVMHVIAQYIACQRDSARAA
jgi:D-sedoheptulose 7-phosphate isomerase